MKKEIVIHMENVGKTYQLGKIGAKTLQRSFQSWLALKRGKEDPNSRIGQRQERKGNFEALRQISFDVKKGERVGIIGKNGAGKSTLLKLLSRVTTPTAGKICINGRISSMLEVGAGFHGELTGRENIYLKGAILGMSQKEIAEKVDEIIAFSECERFIDTPVKRYSSGMYVKLAFSVAAHLNTDIFLMDEVLAVGDMAFQKKCLAKMKELSKDGEKTILYVSHNMQTVRELCDRCIVLEEGTIIHDGDVNEGIRLYMQEVLEVKHVYEFTKVQAYRQATENISIFRIEIEEPVVNCDCPFLCLHIHYQSQREMQGIHMRFTIHDQEDCVVGTAISDVFSVEGGKQQVSFAFDCSLLAEGEYSADIVFVEPIGGQQIRHAYLERAIAFQIERQKQMYQIPWSAQKWGRLQLNDFLTKN